MKKALLISLGIVLMGIGAAAQSSLSFSARVQIPFDFVVRGDTLPAGLYVIQIPGPVPGPVMVRPSRGNKSEIVLEVPTSERWDGRAQLSFEEIAGTHYLVQIADPRAGVQRVLQGDRYKEARKSASLPRTVVVSALR